MINRAGLQAKSVQSYKPGDDFYDTAKEYMVQGTEESFATIKDTFLAEDGKDHDLNKQDGAVELDNQDLFVFLGPGSGHPGQGLYTGSADENSVNYRHSYSGTPGENTYFGTKETAEDGTVSMLTARHYGDLDHEPSYSLTTIAPDGTITLENGVPTADFDPIMATRGTQPYLGELE